jgi:hypothetical protein
VGARRACQHRVSIICRNVSNDVSGGRRNCPGSARVVSTCRPRANRLPDSTSWGSLVRAQYRPSSAPSRKPPSEAVFGLFGALVPLPPEIARNRRNLALTCAQLAAVCDLLAFHLAGGILIPILIGGIPRCSRSTALGELVSASGFGTETAANGRADDTPPLPDRYRTRRAPSALRV